MDVEFPPVLHHLPMSDLRRCPECQGIIAGVFSLGRTRKDPGLCVCACVCVCVCEKVAQYTIKQRYL